MRLNWHLRGIDLIDVEFHAGSKGLYLDVSIFNPRGDVPAPVETRADLTGATSAHIERAPQEAWADDQPALVKLGFR